MAETRGSGMFTKTEFTNRGVIKLAPDALVYIGGNMETQIIAPVSNKQGNLSFNDGISSISVQNVVDPPGSSTATIEIVSPIYGPDSNYWVSFATADGITRAPVFVPMMEVKVYFKGRFMVDDATRYYPAFWGFITQVEESYSGGLHKITLQCADILHWWSSIKVTIHPVPESNIASGGLQKLTVYSTVFDRDNPFEIIYKLVAGIGFSEFVAPTWLAQSTPLQSIYPPNQFRKVVTGLMEYWRNRLGQMGNLLKMYGVLSEKVDVTVKGQTVTSVKPNKLAKKKTSKDSESQASTEEIYNVAGFKIGNMLHRFTVFFDYEKMGTFQEAEKMSKLDIAIEVKTRSDFEFFQDVNGNFIFKPPFFNMDVRGIKSYEIEPYDIMSFTMATNSDAVVTALQVHTSSFEQLRQLAFARGEGYHIDIELAKRYGFRFEEINVEYIYDKTLARTMAVAKMNMINARAISGSVTIPGRPEMRLGYPVYLRHRDSFHYVKSISHTFDYGGTFSTTLALETDRNKLYDFDGQNWTLLKDKVYRFSGNILDTYSQKIPSKESEKTPTENKRLELLRYEQRVVSLPQGRYDTDDRKAAEELGITDKTVPLTDEHGYKVVGAFPYGRGINPLVIDSDTLNYSYNKDNIQVTNMGVGSLDEASAMARTFVTGKEGIVPRYLLVSQISAGESDELPPDAITDGQGVKTNVNNPPVGQKTSPPPIPSQGSVTNIVPTGQTQNNDQRVLASVFQADSPEDED